MPRKATNATSTAADNYDGPAKHTRGAQRPAIANANPAPAPVAAPVVAQQQSSAPATRTTRCAGTVRAAVKKQTKATKVTTATRPKRKTSSTKKPAAAVKNTVALSPTKVRATRATGKKSSGNPPPKPDRQLRKLPTRTTNADKADPNKDLDTAADDEPTKPSGYRVIKPAPAGASLPTKAADTVAPAPLPSVAIAAPEPAVDAVIEKNNVKPVRSKGPKATTALKAAAAVKANVKANNANTATTTKAPPLPSKSFRVVVPRAPTPSFRVVFPRADTPKADNTPSTPAQRTDSNADAKKLSPRDMNIGDVVEYPVIDVREESQDLGDVMHYGNENVRPVFEGANAIVDAFNHVGRANGVRTRSRRDGKAKAYRPKAGNRAPLPSPSPDAPAAAPVTDVPPLPHRYNNARRVAAVTPSRPPSPSAVVSGSEGEEVAVRAKAAATNQKSAGTREVYRSEVKTVRVKNVKVEEQTDDELLLGEEEESSDDEEAKRAEVWFSTLNERINRTAGWAQVRQESVLAR